MNGKEMIYYMVREKIGYLIVCKEIKKFEIIIETSSRGKATNYS